MSVASTGPFTKTGGDPTPTPPCGDLHPPGPTLVIGGALRFCPYCDSPDRGPHRRAMDAAQLTNVNHGQRADRVEGSRDPITPVTIDDAAAVLDASPPSVERGTTTGTRGRVTSRTGGTPRHPPTAHNIFTACHRRPRALGHPPDPLPHPHPPGRWGAGCRRDLGKPAPRPYNFPFAPPSFGRFVWDSSGNMKIVYQNRR
jgi:hypothetical protein